MENSFNVIGVIPARYASKRLPAKLLRSICGKTLLQWTWENASSARALDKLIIACDHPEVEAAAKGFGAEVVVTSPEHPSGTDRIAEAVVGIEAKIIINIQADEPLINPSVINSLAYDMLDNPDLSIATAKKKIDREDEINNCHVVKIVCDRNGFALYFSRSPIPCYRQDNKPIDRFPYVVNEPVGEQVYYKHLGIYAYTKDFLYTFRNLPHSYLEQAEKLEQLRIIEAGHKMKVIETNFDSSGVDTEADLLGVEKILSERNCG